MAEYTIPKPYRDFYVTNPYIELKESNERLQKIVKSGYVATDSFDLVGNQIIHFDKEKHGFSLTNDSSKGSTWSININNADLWEQGTVKGTGEMAESTVRIRFKETIGVIPGADYTFSFVSSSSNSYQLVIAEYDQNGNYIAFKGFFDPSSTYEPETNTRYIRPVLRISTEANITPESVFTDTTSFSLSVVPSSYTAPSDVTVKVAENVAGIPTTADGWEQGAISKDDGKPSVSSKYIRTKSFFDVKPNQQYTLSYSSNQMTLYFTCYEYNENNEYIRRHSSDETTFITSDQTTKMKIIVSQSGNADITVENFLNDITNLRMTTEKMIIQENDTRIVTMPPFTSLYIESNVPYHGHALDLAE